jgi:anti-sigma B factor antagonist
MSDTTVDVVRDGSTAILRIRGEITGGSEPPIMAAYTQAGDARSIVLDFSQLEYMNSGGIGLLVTLLVRTQRAGQKLLAAGLTEHYRQILALTRLDAAITICEDETAALAAASA